MFTNGQVRSESRRVPVFVAGVVAALCSALLVAGPAGAAPGGNGGATTVDAVLNCEAPTVTATSSVHPISNIVVAYADGTTMKIEEPFDQVDAEGNRITLFAYEVALDMTNPITAVWVKAGNNGQRGKANRGLGAEVPVDTTPCVDRDGDGVPDTEDNCPHASNPDQANNLAHLGITTGDACPWVDFDESGVNDLDEYPHACIMVWQPGAVEPVVLVNNSPLVTQCFVGAPTDSLGPNTAVGFSAGGRIEAQARFGATNSTAIGVNTSADLIGWAYARLGESNVATAIGLGPRATIQSGSNNTATATGRLATATIETDSGTASGNVAIASGDESLATITQGSKDNNTATALAERSQAKIQAGSFNVATATSPFCSATVSSGNLAVVVC